MAANNNSGKRAAMTEVLTALATSGDAWVKMGTLLLVAASGLFNFLATEWTGAKNRSDIDRQTSEIWHALDRNKDEFHQLVRDAEISRDKTTRTLENTNISIQNQTKLLENQQKILNELHRWQQNYKNPTNGF